MVIDMNPSKSLFLILSLVILTFAVVPRISSSDSKPFNVRILTFNPTKKTAVVARVAPLTSSDKPANTLVAESTTTLPTIQTVTTGCSGGTTGNVIVVSISQRYLWACEGSKIVYQTAVVTGDMNIVADATPIGTFHIYSKQTSLYLRGSDSRGSWNDYVSYWIPFLDNQYGVFGMHDATWRSASDFGTISQYSDNASHGCIELPLAAAAFLYNWSSIGTPLVIEG